MANSQGEAFLGCDEMELYDRKRGGLEQIKKEIAQFGTDSDKVRLGVGVGTDLAFGTDSGKSVAPILTRFPWSVFCFKSRLFVVYSWLLF